jgi:hypothetical protein
MSMPRPFRLFALTLGALASTAVLWLGAAPAGAVPGASLQAVACIPLLQKCPPPTTATTKPAVTTVPLTTVLTTTTRPKTSTPTTAAVRATTTTTARNTPGVASVGAPGVPSAALAPGDLAGLATGADPAAPQLAGIPAPAPSATVVVTIPPALSGLVGTDRGLPNDHASLRLALSVVVLLVAGVAVAQLPTSRRFPRPSSDTPD